MSSHNNLPTATAKRKECSNYSPIIIMEQQPFEPSYKKIKPNVVFTPQKPLVQGFCGGNLSHVLKDKPLKDFLNLQEEELILYTADKSEGLFLTKTISRDDQLECFAKGILNHFCNNQLRLNRSQDYPLFEIRGPVGSGKTHFMLNATREIANRLSDGSEWLEKEFEMIWSNSYLTQDESIPPTNWRSILVEGLKYSVKTFATQRNGTAWCSTIFEKLTASQYIAAMLAINHLSPTEKHRFKTNNFENFALDLNSVLDLIREKYKKKDKLLILEFIIDEVQNIEENSRKTKLYELLSTLHLISSTRRDLLFIPVIGGTTVPERDKDEDAHYNIYFVSLLGIAIQVINMNTLTISNTIDLIKLEYPLIYNKLMQLNIEELVNLLLLIGPLPRCLELLIRELQTSNETLIIAHDIYNRVKSRLLLKYSAKKSSMLANHPKDIIKILQHILEGRTGLTDTTIHNALKRGLICYESSGIVSVIFVYLHIALCENDLLKNEINVTLRLVSFFLIFLLLSYL